jgi:chaperone required for assembly of F1-ATPase
LLSLVVASGDLKSCSLAMLMLEGVISVEDAFKASRMEEDYQAGLYGRVEGHHDLDEGIIK